MLLVHVLYDGETYTVSGRGLDDVEREISAILSSGRHGWLTAFGDDGSRIPHRLLITPGVALALVPMPGD
jgi:hypothetical protein